MYMKYKGKMNKCVMVWFLIKHNRVEPALKHTPLEKTTLWIYNTRETCPEDGMYT